LFQSFPSLEYTADTGSLALPLNQALKSDKTGHSSTYPFLSRQCFS
jgi:hypothetical protein